MRKKDLKELNPEVRQIKLDSIELVHAIIDLLTTFGPQNTEFKHDFYIQCLATLLSLKHLAKVAGWQNIVELIEENGL